MLLIILFPVVLATINLPEIVLIIGETTTTTKNFDEKLIIHLCKCCNDKNYSKNILSSLIAYQKAKFFINSSLSISSLPFNFTLTKPKLVLYDSKCQLFSFSFHLKTILEFCNDSNKFISVIYRIMSLIIMNFDMLQQLNVNSTITIISPFDNLCKSGIYKIIAVDHNIFSKVSLLKRIILFIFSIIK